MYMVVSSHAGSLYSRISLSTSSSVVNTPDSHEAQQGTTVIVIIAVTLVVGVVTIGVAAVLITIVILFMTWRHKG